jgi:hypothetical protein
MFSEYALRQLVKQHDAYVKISTSEGINDDHRLIAYISRDKDVITGIEYESPVEQSSKKVYERYIKEKDYELDQTKSLTAKWLHMGLLSRQVEHFVNEGEYSHAREPIFELKSIIESEYDSTIENFSHVVEYLGNRAEKTHFDEFMNEYHPCTGKFLYYYAMWLLNHKSQYVTAYKLFKHSMDLFDMELTNFRHFHANLSLKEAAEQHQKVALERKLNEISND